MVLFSYDRSMKTLEKNKLSLIMFAGYLLIFSVIDYLNVPYLEMARTYSWSLVIINIFLNITMSAISAYIFSLHEDFIKQSTQTIKGSNAPIYASLFGILTYGCTPCVISFFAMIGINFSVMALPWAGLPYKLISLAILLVGAWFVQRQTKKACKI